MYITKNYLNVLCKDYLLELSKVFDQLVIINKYQPV